MSSQKLQKRVTIYKFVKCLKCSILDLILYISLETVGQNLKSHPILNNKLYQKNSAYTRVYTVH